MRSHSSRLLVDEAGAAADAGVAEHQVDVVGGVLAQQLVAEPMDLRLVGDVACVAGDENTTRRAGLADGRGIRDRVGVPVAGRDRASVRGQLPDKLPAHARAAAGHHRELAVKPICRS